MASRPNPSARRFPARRGGARSNTRGQLLETAGEVFAERGVDATTGLEISQRANVNAAAINYYFGGMEGLYEAVLGEAVRRMPRLETLSALVAQNPAARVQLRAVIALAAGVITGPPDHAWIVRLLMREVVSPSAAFDRLILQAEGLPKVRLFGSIVAQIMDLPVDHPAVALGCICVLAPCQVMLIGQATLLERAFPDLDLSPVGAPSLVERLTTFALAGLDGIARTAKG